MALTSVTDRDDNTLKEYAPECKQVLDSTVANQVATTLALSVNQYYGGVRLPDGRPYAAKSGTTDDNANTWFTGFTPELSTSTWVGHANSSTTPVQNVTINGQYYALVYGVEFGGPKIWVPYMYASLAGSPIQGIPYADIGKPVPDEDEEAKKKKEQEQQMKEAEKQTQPAPEAQNQGDSGDNSDGGSSD